MYFYREKTDKYDILYIPDGFSYVAKNRKIFKHKFGGIVVVYRNNLKYHIRFLHSNSDYVSWLKISQVFNNDLLLGCVYSTSYLKTLYIRQ